MLSLVHHDDPILKMTMQTFRFGEVDANKISLDLIEVMSHYRALGLSANQVGLPYRVFVMETSSGKLTCFNPKIVDEVGKQSFKEGCLSFPGLNVKVFRPMQIRARFADVNGNVDTKVFQGLAATVFQHELDHLNGVTFFEKANFLNRDIAKKEWKRLKGKTWT